MIPRSPQRVPDPAVHCRGLPRNLRRATAVTSEIRSRLSAVSEILGRVRIASSYETQCLRLAEIESQMAEGDFWNDRESAEKTIQELKRVKETVTNIDGIEKRLGDAEALLDLAKTEQDHDSKTEAASESRQLLAQVERLELRTLLSGRHDVSNAYLSIHAGAGGTEACDWVSMLRRMFLRWAEINGFGSEVIEELSGDETGFKTFTARIIGAYAYGYLRAETGVHRLVRVSPFDAQARRHTTFASVHASPEVDDVDIEISESDLRVDTYRASGAGGQHVNTTDSAVRITHLPTGIVVQCQNQRSQHANRAQAMLVLQSRLTEFEEKKREEEMAKLSGERSEIAFGSQIRSYVLHPYKMVKDHRTDHETGNVDATLDGELQPFIEEWLRQQAQGGGN